ncbi:MAG: hypothetical protein Q9164_005296 [Protoblastenia rupestris]
MINSDQVGPLTSETNDIVDRSTPISEQTAAPLKTVKPEVLASGKPESSDSSEGEGHGQIEREVRGQEKPPMQEENKQSSGQSPVAANDPSSTTAGSDEKEDFSPCFTDRKQRLPCPEMPDIGTMMPSKRPSSPPKMADIPGPKRRH